MGLINYEQLEDGFDASANLWNERFGILFNEINGNLDSANLKNGAVTNPKIAPGAVTSDKLGFEQYVDDNGWLITDLGLVKLATKKREWNFARNTELGAVIQSNFTGADALNPVGFNPSAQYNVMWNISGNQSRFLTFQVDAEIPRPNHNVAAKVIQSMSGNAKQYVHTWVIF